MVLEERRSYSQLARALPCSPAPAGTNPASAAPEGCALQPVPGQAAEEPCTYTHARGRRAQSCWQRVHHGAVAGSHRCGDAEKGLAGAGLEVGDALVPLALGCSWLWLGHGRARSHREMWAGGAAQLRWCLLRLQQQEWLGLVLI